MNAFSSLQDLQIHDKVFLHKNTTKIFMLMWDYNKCNDNSGIVHPKILEVPSLTENV